LAISLKSLTDLGLKYPEGNQKPLFLASFAINSLFSTQKPFADWFGGTVSTTRKSVETTAVSRVQDIGDGSES